MPWKKAVFSNEDIQTLKHWQLLRDFADLMIRARGPADAAIFGKMRPAPQGGGIEEEVFFSPELVELFPAFVAQLGAVDSEAPIVDPAEALGPFGLCLLAGSQRAWNLVQKRSAGGTTS